MIARTDKVTTTRRTMRRRKTVIKPSACNLPVSNGAARCTHLGKMRLLAFAIGAQALMSTSIAATLEDISYTTLPGNQQQIDFTLSESVTETNSFQMVPVTWKALT